MTIDNPLRWLLDALPGYVDPEHLAQLMERYEANKQAYARQIAIRHAERIVKTLERRNAPHEDAQLVRWKAKLDKLKEETL